MWLIILSDQLPVIALVSHYPTNKLMGREPISKRQHDPYGSSATFDLGPFGLWSYPVLAPLSRGYPNLGGRLPTYYSPVRHFTLRLAADFSFDLHVLGTPPAFVLSQDQTLRFYLFPVHASNFRSPPYRRLSLFSFQRAAVKLQTNGNLYIQYFELSRLSPSGGR